VLSPRAGGSGAAEVDAEQSMAAMQHFRTAETQLQRGDLNGALAAAESAVAGDPSQTEYAALRAWVAALAKGGPQVNQSILDLDQLLMRDPSSERALLYRGKLYKRANRPDEALRDLERLLTINPKHREATGEVRLLKMHVKKA
jgi:tetratricopeptide (TPR) repeat protein